MGYQVKFKINAVGVETPVTIFKSASAPLTETQGALISELTAIDWNEGAKIGRGRDIIPRIKNGLERLGLDPKRYEKMLEAGEHMRKRGAFRLVGLYLAEIILDWYEFKKDYPELIDVVTLWIE